MSAAAGAAVGARSVRQSVIWVVLLLIAVATAFPYATVLLNTFKSTAEYTRDPTGLPDAWTLENLRAAWTGANFSTYAVNSVIVVGLSLALLLAVSSLAGYALAKLGFPGRRVFFYLTLALMIMPTSVMMVPIFRTVLELQLFNSYLGLALVYAGLNLPFSIYLMQSYFESVPDELAEAGQVDGASPVRIFWSVALPLVRPGLLTVATLNFLWLWNEMLFSLVILQEEGKRTLMVGLATLQGQYTTSVPLVSAGLLLASLPPILIFVFFQRNLSLGMTAGAVK